MGKVSYRPKKNQGKQEVKKQYNSKKPIPEVNTAEVDPELIDDVMEEVTKEVVQPIKFEEKVEKISANRAKHHKKQNVDKIDSVKVIGDMECAYHVYIEDYVYTYLYQFAASDLAKESAAMLVGEIYSESKEAVIRGIIPVNMDKLGSDVDWIDLGVAEEAEEKRKNYFKEQDIIGWMHMQPGYGTMLTMKELREHQNVFEGDGTICLLVDAINKIETVYVYEDNELKEQSGYCMYYERNEDMQQYMLDHPFTNSSKEEMKDTVVNQFREIGKIRKAEYNQKRNLNFTVVTASIILIALTAVIVKMNESRGYNQAAQMVSTTPIIEQQNMQQVSEPSADLDLSNYTEVIGNEVSEEVVLTIEPENLDNANDVVQEMGAEELAPVEEAEVVEESVTPVEDIVNEVAQNSTEYNLYVVQSGDTLADICYKEYGNATRSLEVAQFNGLESTNQIYVGQELKMPR